MVSRSNDKLNEKIIEEFKLLIKQIKYQMDNTSGKESIKHSFRLESIKKALYAIENFKTEIKDANQLKDLKGIGKGSLKRVEEILSKGKLSEIKIKGNENEYLSSIENLMKVFGIGRKKAHELVIKHDIKDIKDLKKLHKNKEIELPDNIIKGLKYVDKTKTAIPRTEIDHIYVYLVKTAIEINLDLNVVICGSYRRKKPKSNDIDVLLFNEKIISKDEAESSDLMKKFIDKLYSDKFLIDAYTASDVPTKFMGLCRYKKGLMRRIDIRLIPFESIYAAQLYFTGSGNFNKKMRRVALDLGYTLNEYGLIKPNGEMTEVHSEKDIFDALGMEYLDPQLRL
jgi:DNA polymerase/3'-5' exonuclease PolX